MGINVSYSQGYGLLVPDGRLTLANALPTGTLTASYTQAGPRPGMAVPDQDTEAVLLVGGTQSAGGQLEVRGHAAGMSGVGPGTGAVVWRDVAAGHSTSQMRGENNYNLITGWEALRYQTVAGFTDPRLSVVRLLSGELLVVGDQFPMPFGVHSLYRIAPTETAWTTITTAAFADVPSAVDFGPACAVYPDGSIVLWLVAQKQTPQSHNVHAYRSVDKGATWTMVARNCLIDGVNPAATLLDKVACYSNGQVSLLVAWELASIYSVSQYASSDLGMTFDLVLGSWQTTYDERVQSPQLVALPGGAFLVGYYADPGVAGGGNEKYRCRKIATAYSPPESAVDITPDGDAPTAAQSPRIALARDEDGIIHAVYRRPSTDRHSTAIKLSANDGETWLPSTMENRVFQAEGKVGATNGDLVKFGLGITAGRAALVTRWNATTATVDQQSIGCIWLGGAASHTGPLRYYATSPWKGFLQIALAEGPENIDAECYLPIDEPQNLGWTPGGTGGDADDGLLIPSGRFRIDTTGTGNSRFHSRQRTTTNALGGWLTADITIPGNYGSVGSQNIVIDFWASDGTSGGAAGTWTCKAQIRMERVAGVVKYSLWDVVGPAQIGADVTVGSTQRFRLAVALSGNGYVNTWWSTDVGFSQTWTEAAGGAITNAALAQDSWVRWGVQTPSLTMVDVSLTGCNWGCASWRLGGSANIGQPTEWINPTDVLGRPISTSPVLVVDGVRVGLVRGPLRIGETWQIRPAYDYPVDSLHVLTEASPDRTWRSAGTGAVQSIVWRPVGAGLNTLLENSSYALGIFGGNFEACYLDGYDGAAWTTLLTANAATGLAGLSYDRTGDCLTVRAGSATAGRYLYPDELVGATANMDGTLRRIRRNTSGIWRDSANVEKPRVYLEGITGAEPANGANLKLLCRNHVTYAHDLATAYEAFRLRITIQTTVDGFFELGTVVIGGIVYLGKRPAFGTQIRRESTTETFVARSGATRVVQRGRPFRTVTLPFTDPLDAQQILGLQPDPNFVRGSLAGLPVASRASAYHVLEHLVAVSDGPRIPVVYLPRLSQTGTTENDPNLLLLGRLTGIVERDNVLGLEGMHTMDRIAAITLAEVR